jgi:hypothetical protein
MGGHPPGGRRCPRLRVQALSVPTCGEVSARAVVMGLWAALALVLGLVLARLWWQRRGSRSGEVTRWFQAHGTPTCTSVMRGHQCARLAAGGGHPECPHCLGEPGVLPPLT